MIVIIEASPLHADCTIQLCNEIGSECYHISTLVAQPGPTLLQLIKQVFNKYIPQAKCTQARVYIHIDRDRGLRMFACFLKAIVQTSLEVPRAGYSSTTDVIDSYTLWFDTYIVNYALFKDHCILRTLYHPCG